MTVLQSLVDGQPLDTVSASDRGLLYGQSIFETIVVQHKIPLLLEEHLQRMGVGAQRLNIPFSSDDTLNDIQRLCDSLDQQLFVLRVTLTMGEGGRGYANPDPSKPVRVITAHAYPDYPADYAKRGVKLGLSSVCLADQPLLAGIKHGNRLEQVLARQAWHDDWQEAVLLNQAGEVVEATQSNIFARKGNAILTPTLDRCGVEGVMRAKLIELGLQSSWNVIVGALRLPDLQLADEVFLTNSVIGVWPVKEFQSSRYADFSATNEFTDLLREHGAIPSN